MRGRACVWLLLCLVGTSAVVLTACGDATSVPTVTNIGDALQSARGTLTADAAPTTKTTTKPTRSVDNFNATSTALAQTPRATRTAAPAATGAVADAPQGCPATLDNPRTRDVVCTFHDSRGKNAYLYYGRGTGHSGDYGWAHIKGKHIDGIWYDGGIVTTYPTAFGTTSDVQVLSLINKALQDPQPKPSGDRFEFRYKPNGSRYNVLAVVGSDGTIITAYPES